MKKESETKSDRGMAANSGQATGKKRWRQKKTQSQKTSEAVSKSGRKPKDD